MTTEDYLRSRLADLHREYQEKAEPYLKALADLQALKPPPPIILTKEDAERLGFRFRLPPE